MALSQIFDYVNGKLGEAVPGLTTGKTGSDIFAAGAAPPRVVWVPTSEGFDHKTAQGGDDVSNPRHLCNRVVLVEVHLWAADDDAVEALLNIVVSNVHDALGGPGYEPAGGDWLATDALGKSGSAYVLHLQIFVPVTHTPDLTAPMPGFAPPTTVVAPAGS